MLGAQLLLCLLDPAETAHGQQARLGRGLALGQVMLDLLGQVKAQLVIQLALQAPLVPRIAQPAAQPAKKRWPHRWST